MKEKLLYLLCVCSLLMALSPGVSAQNLLTDSLKKSLQQKDVPTHQRLMTMVRLADITAYRSAAKAISLYQRAIQTARETKDNDVLTFGWSGQATAEARQKNPKTARRDIDSALFYADKAAPLYHGIALYRKGWMQNFYNQPDQAMKIWQKAQQYLNEPKGAQYQANLYNLKFGIYSERGQKKKARHYALLSLKRAIQSREPTAIVAAWQINGTYYLQRYHDKNNSQYLDSAVHAFQESVTVFKNQKKRIKSPGIVILSILNLANIYLDHYPPEYADSILHHIDLALEVSRSVHNEVMLANTYETMYRVYHKIGDLKRAERAVMHAKTIADTLHPQPTYLALNVYLLCAQLEEQKGDLKKALLYYKKYVGFYRKEFNTQQNKTIQQLEAKYQSEKKEEALKRLKQRNSFQKKQNRLYIGIALVAILGLLFLFLAYRFKLKYAKQREKSNQEETARLRAEQNLMESEKERLQKELMAGALQVQHKNEILENLQQKLQENENQSSEAKLKKLIRSELRSDEDFEQIKKDLKDIHPDFIARLQKNTQQKLTQLDLKYCAYFSLQLSTKQIAELLNVAPKSVRMAKYRLKKKLEVKKEMDLDDFLQQLDKK